MGAKLSVVVLMAISDALIKVARHLDPLCNLDSDIKPTPDQKPITQEVLSPEKVFSAPPLEIPPSLPPDPTAVDPTSPETTVQKGVIENNNVNQTSNTESITHVDTSIVHTLTELDAESLPWDSRIHASSKKKLARGGTWKLRRGVDPALVEKVKAKLKSTMGAPVNTQVDTPPLPPPPTTPPPPPVTGEITTLPQLMEAALKAKKTPAELNAACEKCGVAGAPLLAARSDLIPAVAKVLGL